MSGTKRDYKARNQYNKTKKTKRKTEESRTAIIVRYVIYLILILIVSIIIGWFLTKNTDKNNSKSENQIKEEHTSGDNVNPQHEIKSFLLINISTDGNTKSKEKEIIAYYLFFYYNNKISYIVMPPSMELPNGNILHRRITKPEQYENLSNEINNQFAFLSNLGFVVINNDIIDNISKKLNTIKYYNIKSSQLIPLNKYSIEYQNLKSLDNNSTKNEIFNYIAYHSFLIRELLLNYHFIISNYNQDIIILDNSKKTNYFFITEVMNSLSRRNIKHIEQPYETNESGYIFMKKENSQNLYKSIKDENHQKNIDIKISVVNGTSVPFDPDKIITYLKSNYNISVSDYKNGNIIENTVIINWNKNIEYSFRLSKKMKYIPVSGSIFNYKKDFQLVLYLGQDYEKYINLDTY